MLKSGFYIVPGIELIISAWTIIFALCAIMGCGKTFGDERRAAN